MDYKITNLNKKVVCDQQLLPDIPTLLYGNINDGALVFDSTAFYESSSIEEINYVTFQRLNKRYIGGFINNTSLKSSELFFLNTDGHVLMNHELTFLFLSFANPTLAAYFNGLIGELMSNGVAYSDGYVLSLASEKIPTEFLQQIINERNDSQK